MKKLTTSLIGFLFLAIACNKQDAKAPEDARQEDVSVITKRNCGSYEVLQAQLAADPGLSLRMQKIEAYTEKVLKDPGRYRLVNRIVEIPVVVHILYKTAAQNISDAQVQSQIDVLNEDFQNKNPDRNKVPSGFHADASTGLEIRFVLALVRHIPTNVNSWSTNDAVKYTDRGGDNAIEPGTNLNLWVCNLGRGLLGYAQFPGGSASTDGVVILYSAFGSRAKFPGGTYVSNYDLGRTATHEVGHWMNLRHIWGDDGGACNGSDLVDDTPNQGAENYGVPGYPHVSCGNSPNGDMFMNYMDYTNDVSMYMFSAKQKDRMLAIFKSSASRASFGTP